MSGSFRQSGDRPEPQFAKLPERKFWHWSAYHYAFPKELDDNLPERRFGPIHASTWLATMVVFFDLSAVAALTGPLSRQFDSTYFSWIAAIYAVSQTITTAICTPLSQIFGIAVVYMAALVAYFGGIAACAWAPGIASLLVGRMLCGAAGGILMTLPFNMLLGAKAHTTSHQFFYTGLQISITGVGLALGGGSAPLILPLRWVFLGQLGPIGLCFVVSWRFLYDVGLRKSPNVKQMFLDTCYLDFLGAIMLGAALAALVFLMNVTTDRLSPYRDAKLWAIIVFCSISGAFIVHQFILCWLPKNQGSRRQRYIDFSKKGEICRDRSPQKMMPIIPWAAFNPFFKKGNPCAATFVNCLLQMGSITAMFYVPLYYRTLSLTPMQTGACLMCPGLATAYWGYVTSLHNRVDEKRVMKVGSFGGAVQVLASCLFILASEYRWSAAPVALTHFIFIAGNTMIVSSVANALTLSINATYPTTEDAGKRGAMAASVAGAGKVLRAVGLAVAVPIASAIMLKALPDDFPIQLLTDPKYMSDAQRDEYGRGLRWVYVAVAGVSSLALLFYRVSFFRLSREQMHLPPDPTKAHTVVKDKTRKIYEAIWPDTWKRMVMNMLVPVEGYKWLYTYEQLMNEFLRPPVYSQDPSQAQEAGMGWNIQDIDAAKEKFQQLYPGVR